MWTGTPEEFVGKLIEIREVVGIRVPFEGLLESAAEFRAAVMAITPNRLSGVREGSANLNVIWSPLSSLEVIAKTTGPFQIWETEGQGSYRIPKYEFSDSYAVPAYGVFDHVIHPPRKGHHTFERTFAAFTPQVEGVMGKRAEAAIDGIL